MAISLLLPPARGARGAELRARCTTGFPATRATLCRGACTQGSAEARWPAIMACCFESCALDGGTRGLAMTAGGLQGGCNSKMGTGGDPFGGWEPMQPLMAAAQHEGNPKQPALVH